MALKSIYHESEGLRNARQISSGFGHTLKEGWLRVVSRDEFRNRHFMYCKLCWAAAIVDPPNKLSGNALKKECPKAKKYRRGTYDYS